MSPKKLPKSSNNVFQIMVRTVVREELIPVKTEIKGLTNKVGVIDKRMDHLDKRMDTVEDNVKSFLTEYIDKVLTGQDQIMGELQTMRQERTMHQGQHDNLHSLPDRVEILEKIHPHSQHAQI